MHQEEKFWIISGESSLRIHCLLSFISFLIGESRDLADFSKAFLLKGNNLCSSLCFDGTFLRSNAQAPETFPFFREVKMSFCLLEALYN